MTELAPLDNAALPSGIRSRFVRDINGLRMHVLEAGFHDRDRPLILLLHGFPEIAYSWRKVMVPLAAAGFRVAAPDQRGYGRTTGWDGIDGDLGSFQILNAVRDALGFAPGFQGRGVIGTFRGFRRAWRPGAARCVPPVALMSAPFARPPARAFDTADDAPQGGSAAQHP
jgi:pimeloyl-ACP methyl ester carboxylesterase